MDHAGSGVWSDGVGNNANWCSSDEPDTDDVAIFNTDVAVTLGSNNAVAGLTMSGESVLNTSGFELGVDGLVQLTGSNTRLIIGDAAADVNADDVTINSGSTVQLAGGILTLDEESGTSLVDINLGGALIGNGVVTFADTPVAATTLLVNDGTLTASSVGLTIFSPPPVGTLQINDSSIGGRVDLDGTGEAGIVNVNRNQTLDLNVPMSDTFSGTVNLAHNSTFDSLNAWTLNAGAINANNGFVDGSIPFPDVLADKSYIKGGTLTQTGGTISVVDIDGTLQFDTSFVMNGGNFVNNGHVIFNDNATINNPAVFTMGFNGSDLTVGANAEVTINQTSFNLDGNLAGTVITVNQGGSLTLNLGDYDNDVVTNSFDATINLNDGVIDVDTADAEFVMDGVLNINSTAAGPAGWLGEPVDIGNDSGSLDADVNVTGSNLAAVQFQAAVDFNSDADVNVAAGGDRWCLNSTVNFDTVNGGNNAEFTGAGTLSFVTVSSTSMKR